MEAKNYPAVCLLLWCASLSAAPVHGQEAGHPTVPGSKVTEYLIPDSFLNGTRPDTLSVLQTGTRNTLIPAQFTRLVVISEKEQRERHDAEIGEALYRKQRVPGYFEATREAFQKEFQKRLKEKSLVPSNMEL
jgi:hypothetical protein